MDTYIILSRFAPMAYRDPLEIRDLAGRVKEEIRKRCPDVEWRDSYATSGSFDVVDIILCDDRRQVERAARLIHAFGRCATRVLAAEPWKEFLKRL